VPDVSDERSLAVWEATWRRRCYLDPRVSGNVIAGASTKAPSPHHPPAEDRKDPQPIDRSNESHTNRFQAELARDPWGRVMVTTPVRVPRWVPQEIREQIEQGASDGFSRFTSAQGRKGLLYSRRSEGQTTHELFQYLPEDDASYLAVTSGDADAARRLRDCASQWNREMRHLVEELGMPPSEAMAEIRIVDAEVFRQIVYAAALLVTSGAALGMVGKLPGAHGSKPARPTAPEASIPPAPKPLAAGARILGTGERALSITPKQLQAKFKHADQFGVAGNYNKQNAEAFAEAIERHVMDPEVQIIQGTYRGRKVTHFYHPRSRRDAIRNEEGAFETGFVLHEKQAMNVTTRGSL
jgi:hypothetical protein